MTRARGIDGGNPVGARVGAAGDALDLDGRLPEANRAMSVVLLQNQDTTSRFYAERAIDGAPNDAETLVTLWTSKGSALDGAEILQAITNNPRLLLAHTQRGVVLLPGCPTSTTTWRRPSRPRGTRMRQSPST